MSEPVAIVGGTGFLGSAIARRLLDEGATLRVLSRSEARIRGCFGGAVHAIEGSLERRQDVDRLLEGASRLLISVSAFSRELFSRYREIERDAVLLTLERAKAHGISRVVYISVYDLPERASEDLAVPALVADTKREVEAEVFGSGMNATVLGSSPSMELFHRLLRKDRLIAPGGGPRALPNVAPADLAAVAAEALRRDDLGDQRFRVLGPDTVSFGEAASILSEAQGHPIRAFAVPRLPFILGSVLLRPFSPYVATLLRFILLMSRFPWSLAEQAPADFARLTGTFNYTPTTLAAAARQWSAEVRKD